MGIFTRLSDIVNSNLNHLLDRAEDPDKMIRLMIQEMEDTLVEVRSSAARVIADRKELDRHLTRLQTVKDDWFAKAQLALEKDREDLAAAALAEKSKLAQMATSIEQERAPLTDALGKYETDIISLEKKIKEAKTKQRSLIERQQSAGLQLKVRERLSNGRVEDVLSRFGQMERRVEDMESLVEAADMGREKSLSDEFAELESHDEIAIELAELKAKMAKSHKAAK